MSFVGTVVIACIHPSALPSRLTSLDDLATVSMDEAAAVYTFSRNGWIGNRLEELARLGYIELALTAQSPAAVIDTEKLGKFIADLTMFLERLPREPLLLSADAREQADDMELSRSIELAPASLEAALSALNAAKSRDEEQEGLETLVCLLWCLLRLAEHARANGMHLICVRSR